MLLIASKGAGAERRCAITPTVYHLWRAKGGGVEVVSCKLLAEHNGLVCTFFSLCCCYLAPLCMKTAECEEVSVGPAFFFSFCFPGRKCYLPAIKCQHLPPHAHTCVSSCCCCWGLFAVKCLDQVVTSNKLHRQKKNWREWMSWLCNKRESTARTTT